MFEPIHHKTGILAEKNLIRLATTRGALLLIMLTLVCFGLLPPNAFGVSPPPDGGYPNGNTAEGTNALLKLTSGTDNTAVGDSALFSTTDGRDNTAIGFHALYSNTTGTGNTATGLQALWQNTTGFFNTANGYFALYSNTTGYFNTATGESALISNTTGVCNTATGESALWSNSTGNNNTATGFAALTSCFGDDCGLTGNNNTATGANALYSELTGNNNTATGESALYSNTTGSGNTANGVNALFSNSGNNNTAEGFQALAISTGSNNVAVGYRAGINLTTGDNNIAIGARGFAGESDTIRIGRVGVQKAAYIQGISGATVGAGVTVIVDNKGRLGTVQSSLRFKDEIKPMGKASEAILALKPVTFRYKQELDPEGIPQFGLVAEQVEKVDPALVTRDENGKAYTDRYEAVNAMLLNEFLKAHCKVEEQGSKLRDQAGLLQEQETTIRRLTSTVAQQQNEIKALAAILKEQAAQIQKVSAQVELSRPASRIIANDQ